MRERSSGDIQVVDRVAQLLSLFTVQKPRLSIAEAAVLVGLNRTTVARYFGSMLSAGLLERSNDDSALYELGPLTLQLGAVARGHRQVLDLAPRHMRALARETGMTVVLSTLGAAGPFVSMVSEVGSPPVLITVRVGTVLSWDSAQGLLFLRFSADTESTAAYLESLTPSQRRSVQRSAAATAERGLARYHSESFSLSVLAAPVFDEHEIVGTVGLLGTIPRLPPDSREHDALLLRTALTLTSELGGMNMWRAGIAETPEPFEEPGALVGESA